MAFAKDDDVVEALSANTAKEAFAVAFISGARIAVFRMRATMPSATQSKSAPNRA